MLQGDIFKKRKIAKAHCALKACMRLYETGELDKEHLRPVKVTFDEPEDEDELEDERERGKRGTKSHKKYYEKKVRPSICKCLVGTLFLWLCPHRVISFHLFIEL